MKWIKLSFILLFTVCSIAVFAERIDTVKIFSASMQKEIPAVVILPDNFSTSKTYPVVYVLHGYGESYKRKFCDMSKSADTYDFIIVSPDGGYGSWYFDSPVDSAFRYETYISRELVEFIDKTYPVIASPAGRAITGNSMGGHGALYLAFRHQNVFGAAGSLSGGVDFRPFPNNWDIAKRLGAYAKNPDNWEKNTVINLVHLLTPNSLEYHSHLAKRYPAEMLEMYCPRLLKLGEAVNNRGEYANLAKLMQKVMRDIPEGKTRIREIARTLIAKNPRRPAMIDELNRVLEG